MTETRLFDLNIEKILEAWESAHAVRELIANAIDEQQLTGTRDIEVFKDDAGAWIIGDYGRGLRYEHFTQNENEEKLRNAGKVIGKFGVGLKDAMATLHRNGVEVEIESAHGVISLAQVAKHGFADVVTLHAAVQTPSDPSMLGTLVRLRRLDDDQMAKAKGFFLRFSEEEMLEETRVGQILRRKPGQSARIYVAGLLVAEEEAFAFSYNITALTEPMRKALNRERTNVGRTAYTERVKQMLLNASGGEIAVELADQLVALQSGAGSDEVRWKEVAVHAVRILSGRGDYLFVSAEQLIHNASAIDHARADGLRIITIPDIIQYEVSGMTDLSGAPIRDLGHYQAEWNDSFQFDFVAEADLSVAERNVFSRAPEIAALWGGMPERVKAVRVSNRMRVDFTTGSDALGLWDGSTSSIVIRRDQLGSMSDFAGTLLHEIVHARTGFDDVTREFESALTDVIGEAAAAAVLGNAANTDASDGNRPRSFLDGLLGRK
ncbi:ATP-binding protein [Sphingomonas sp. NIBR02145]|uniref:ATP-binding protein n=1 Tax=Sphingomonas sp. NIBR02145 TaxID=3014784 RepID=UPI0022B5AC5C|nr:ATP-binding protein [Sphingomonas sp. NIBR02145]WHU03676.1 ATP-binding protein [Sphingomonas sp. NIBR02145]